MSDAIIQAWQIVGEKQDVQLFKVHTWHYPEYKNTLGAITHVWHIVGVEQTAQLDKVHIEHWVVKELRYTPGIASH